MRVKVHTTLISASLVILLLALNAAHAQVRESASYKIQSDSLNVGGGFSASTNYRSESTVGEIATGESGSTSFNLRGGYQQLQEVFLSLSAASDVTMTPSIGGVAGGVSNGSTTVTVTTDSPSGYQLTIQASTSPAMQSGAETIADYVPGGSDPDFVFTTGSTDAHLGYSPAGVEIADRFKDNGAACNTGSGTTTLACWDGLDTTAEVIATKSSGNHPSGTETTVNFRVGVGGSAFPLEGTYVATTTLTLLPL